MPLRFYSISGFRYSVERLCKKEREMYHSCKKDIFKSLGNMTCEEISQNGDNLRSMGKVHIVKVRVPNSLQNLGAVDGFRVILLCNIEKDFVVFLNIFAKRGKQATLNQSKAETVSQVEIFAQEYKNNSLIEHILDEALSVRKLIPD